MDALKDIKEVKKELKQVTSSATGSDRFMAKCFPLMMEISIKQMNLLEKLANKKKRKPSKWNKFVAKHAKDGKTMKEISLMYQK